MSHRPIPAPERCWLDPRVVARPSPIEGLGLFATGPIAKGDAVGILGGRVIDDAELRRIAGLRSKYNSAAIADGLNLLLKDDELLARGNHSCDSNLWMRDEFTLEARRDIAAGEEITVDYALQTSLAEWEMACSCASPRCRRIVRGDDWMRPELRERYRGHFSPFLNRRIEAMDAKA
jgi:SET domain-containing protein